MNKEIDIKKINCDLGLKETEDWGIENDDYSRVKEFINYFNKNSINFTFRAKVDFIELIMSSMNEAMLEKKVDDETTALFNVFLEYCLQDKNILVYDAVIYWKSIAEREEFPVGFLVDELLQNNK